MTRQPGPSQIRCSEETSTSERRNRPSRVVLLSRTPDHIYTISDDLPTRLHSRHAIVRRLRRLRWSRQGSLSTLDCSTQTMSGELCANQELRSKCLALASLIRRWLSSSTRRLLARRYRCEGRTEKPASLRKTGHWLREPAPLASKRPSGRRRALGREAADAPVLVALPSLDDPAADLDRALRAAVADGRMAAD